MSNVHHAFTRTPAPSVPGETIIRHLQRLSTDEGLLEPIQVVEACPPRVVPDNRPEIAIMLDASGDYALPKTTAKGMAVELLSRYLHEDVNGFVPGWNIKMDFSWDKSGVSKSGHETDVQFDEAWADLIENDPTIFENACARALDPWVSDYVDLLECDGEMLCDIILSDTADHLLLKSMSGISLAFETRNDWTRFVMALDEDSLAKLWTACRVLDADLSRKERGIVMAATYSEIRLEKEQTWGYEVEDLSF